MASSLKTLTFDGVLEHVMARLRSWEEPATAHVLPDAPLPAGRSFALGLDRAFALASRAAGSRGLGRAARLLAQTAHALNPHSASAELALGKALVRSGRDRQALLHLRRAAKGEGREKRGSWELARLLLRLERSDADRVAFASASATFSGVPVARRRRSPGVQRPVGVSRCAVNHARRKVSA